MPNPCPVEVALGMAALERYYESIAKPFEWKLTRRDLAGMPGSRPSYPLSAPATEMLVYRGQVSADMPLDSSIFALAEAFPFPLKYGYAAVGRITTLGIGHRPKVARKVALRR